MTRLAMLRVGTLVCLILATGLLPPAAVARWRIADGNAYSARLVCRDGMLLAAGGWYQDQVAHPMDVYINDAGGGQLTAKRVWLRWQPIFHWAPPDRKYSYNPDKWQPLSHYALETILWSRDPGQTVTVWYLNVYNTWEQETYPVLDCRLQNAPHVGSDILWRNQQTGDVQQYLMQGSTIYAARTILLQPSFEWRIEAVADFNGDAQRDILWLQERENRLWFNILSGLASVQTRELWRSDPQWRLVGSGDSNADGQADLLFRHQTTGTVYVLFMDGVEILEDPPPGAVGVEADFDWRIVGSGDWNADGIDDIFWRNQRTGANRVWAIWTVGGNRFYQETQLRALPDQNWLVAAIADFNGDYAADLLWYHRVTGQTDLWLSGSNPTNIASLPHVIQSTDPNWQIVGATDYDRNGLADVLWSNRVTGETQLHLNSGSAWLVRPIPSPGPEWRVVAPAQGDLPGSPDSGNIRKVYIPHARR
jgi:hypothetical protein